MTPQTTDIYPGYALERLELYNWGTFNGSIWQIEPARHTALLTGANGSGKSTLVDALLTLLVPNRRRNYNLSSGDRRGERTEKSYVRGAYSRLRDSGLQYLRDDNEYSVLLAQFRSPGAKQEWVALAQVFYNGGALKFHVVAPLQLSIAEHFSTPGSMNQLRKRLREGGADVFDQFNDYSAAFRKLFRLRSEKALDLFSQTTSIKEIGSLNQFIREHMLEKTDADQQIQLLRDNFHDLTLSYDAILKAERQQSLLQPIVQEGTKYRQLVEQIEEARRCESVVPHYFTYQHITLLDYAIREAQLQHAEFATEMAALQTQHDQIDTKRIELRMAIERDETGQILRRLNESQAQLQRELRERQTRAAQYDLLSKRLELAVYADAAAFHANRQQAEVQIPDLDQQIMMLSRDREKRVRQQERLRPRIEELQIEIKSLEQQRSQIPASNLAMRRQIAEALKIDDEELPFVGELVRVRDDAANWEGALERVLHGFGLTVLVHDTYYKSLSQYVNKQNLMGRLVYRRLEEKTSSFNAARLPANALYHKVEIKADTSFTDWLRAEIGRNFDYACCETLDDFRHQRRAITQAGQIKHSESHHEKDDRFDIHDRTRYVLGWDNRAKLQALQTEYQALLVEAKRIQSEMKRMEGDERQLRTRQDTLKDLLRFDDFAVLDWRSTDAELEANQAEQHKLEASSNRLRQLQEDLGHAEAGLKRLDDDLKRFHHLLHQREEDIQRFEHQQGEAQRYIQKHPVEEWRDYGVIIEQELERRQSDSLSLDNLASVQEETRRYFANRASSFTGQQNTLQAVLLDKIARFRSDYRVETENIGMGIEALPELEALLQRIETDDLPKHLNRFKEMLDKKVRDNIQGFLASLEQQTEDYKEVITHLNASLKLVPYEGNAVYIQLQAEMNPDVEIGTFRAELRACLDDASANTPEALNAAYERIRQLIQRFENPADERWMRKVTDVRNWLDFAALELWRDDNSQKRYHSDSSGMSGGQKAKLAYTILASAVAYQYGIQQSDHPEQTFRFVVVDEAFSKVDDNNARYAMELFQQLGLQLLVVTPLDKLHIVEPYVGAYHYIYNNEEGSNSRIINMTVEAYLEQRASWQQASTTEGRRSDDYA